MFWEKPDFSDWHLAILPIKDTLQKVTKPSYLWFRTAKLFTEANPSMVVIVYLWWGVLESNQ